MPLPAPPTRKLDSAANRSAAGKANNALLFKGILCAAIGLVVLLAPRFSGSPGVQELLAGASAVGWFALALGCALVGLYAVRRFKASRGR